MIEDYGWSPALGHDFAPHAARGLVAGRVVVQRRGHYIVATDRGEVTARLSGRFIHEAAAGEHPAVGDWVALAAAGDGPALAEATSGGAPDEGVTIHALLPRRTAFTRKAADSVQTVQVVAANVDLALLVAAMNGDFNPRRLERYLAGAWRSGARPVVVLTKADLCSDPAGRVAEAESVAIGASVLEVSALTGEGMEALRALLKPGETSVLLGSSGAGKSTLVNALAGACRFSDCGHTNEPGCAVRAALAAGRLDPGRWRSFRKLIRELAFQERKEDHLAREAERRRWAAISKAAKSHRKPRAWD